VDGGEDVRGYRPRVPRPLVSGLEGIGMWR
jgi:hypothetical protein